VPENKSRALRFFTDDGWYAWGLFRKKTSTRSRSSLKLLATTSWGWVSGFGEVSGISKEISFGNFAPPELVNPPPFLGVLMQRTLQAGWSRLTSLDFATQLSLPSAFASPAFIAVYMGISSPTHLNQSLYYSSIFPNSGFAMLALPIHYYTPHLPLSQRGVIPKFCPQLGSPSRR
jgi:hypothetical protein